MVSRNETLNVGIRLAMAHRRHAAAVDSLRRTKMRGDTQAQARAQRRAEDALHDLMRAEREAAQA